MRFKLKTWSPTERIEALQRQLTLKQRDVRRLQHERERLEQRHAVLAALADVLSVIHGWAEESGAPGTAAGAAAAQPEPPALQADAGTSRSSGSSSGNTAGSVAHQARSEREAQLPRQLEQLPLPARSGSDDDGDDDGDGDRGDEPTPIVPADDPMLLMRQLRARGHSGLTVEQFQQQRSALVPEMALQLQLIGAGGGGWHRGAAGASGSGSDAALAQVHVRLRAAVLAEARLFAGVDTGEVMSAVQLTNPVTGERLPEPDVELHRRILRRARLSPKQLRRCRVGAEVMCELHGCILQQLRAAQAECAALAAGGAAAAAAGGAHLLGQLQRQEDSGARLGQLLQCEITFRRAAVLYFVGCLSYAQLAQLLVEAYPYAPAFIVLVRLVLEEQ